MRMFLARLTLILWLAFAVKNDDDLYGTLSSMRKMAECRKVVQTY